MTTRHHHLPCDNCGSSDALSEYETGTYCYSCRTFTPYKGFKRNARQVRNNDVSVSTYNCSLPDDSDAYYPAKALEWITQYGITIKELYDNHVLWSESKQRLIFPFYGNKGELLAWQGRYFGNENRPKWYTSGKIEDVFVFYGQSSLEVVLVEDVVSALKVGRYGYCQPIFGSEVSHQRLGRLSLLGHTQVAVWLDYDKRNSSISFTQRATLLGLQARSIVTQKDPKECSDDDIKKCLTTYTKV